MNYARAQGNLEGVGMFITLTVVIVSWLSAAVEVCQVVSFTYTQLIVCPLHFQKAGGKGEILQEN